MMWLNLCHFWSKFSSEWEGEKLCNFRTVVIFLSNKYVRFGVNLFAQFVENAIECRDGLNFNSSKLSFQNESLVS